MTKLPIVSTTSHNLKGKEYSPTNVAAHFLENVQFFGFAVSSGPSHVTKFGSLTLLLLLEVFSLCNFGPASRSRSASIPSLTSGTMLSLDPSETSSVSLCIDTPIFVFDSFFVLLVVVIVVVVVLSLVVDIMPGNVAGECWW